MMLRSVRERQNRVLVPTGDAFITEFRMEVRRPADVVAEIHKERHQTGVDNPGKFKTSTNYFLVWRTGETRTRATLISGSSRKGATRRRFLRESTEDQLGIFGLELNSRSRW